MTDPGLDQIWVLTENHRWSEAVAASRRYLGGNPGSAYAMRALALSLMRLSSLDEAWTAANEACQLGPQDSWSFIIHSRVALARRSAETSVKSAQHAVELDPAMWQAHAQLATACLFHLNASGSQHFRPAAALAAAREAIRLAPDSAEARGVYAHALRAAGEKREDVTRAYEAVLELEPNMPSALAGLGASHGSRSPAKAARYLTASLALRPDELAFRSSLAWVIYSWINTMVWIWLAGGGVVAALRWFVPALTTFLVTAGLLTVCVLGTARVMRNLPGRAMPELWAGNRYPSRSALVVLLATVVTVTMVAIARASVALPAVVVLGLLAVAHRKRTFARLEWWITVGRRRGRADG